MVWGGMVGIRRLWVGDMGGYGRAWEGRGDIWKRTSP